MTDLPDEVLAEEGLTELGIKIPRAQWDLFRSDKDGCSKCSKGAKGRVGIYEVVRITPAISHIIMDGGNSLDLAKAARKEGFNNLRVSALRKVARGIISLEEANRVTKD